MTVVERGVDVGTAEEEQPVDAREERTGRVVVELTRCDDDGSRARPLHGREVADTHADRSCRADLARGDRPAGDTDEDAIRAFHVTAHHWSKLRRRSQSV